MITWLDGSDADFKERLESLLAYPAEDHAVVRASVEEIIRDVRSRGDEALVELTNRFDGQSVAHIDELRIDKEQMKIAFETLDVKVQSALELSATRVRTYHEQQASMSRDWSYTDDAGNRLGQVVMPMKRVGIYAPGGKAAYPSTVIMTAVPARVAGVEEIILTVPSPDGEVNNTVLGAAWLAGVDEVLCVGGAQAIAALAYGTGTVQAVDKIVGPGNIYVATAKELVFGQVGIDMIAGPSEVVIIADDSAPVEWLIRDMFAQAEHDEWAQSILISTSETLLREVERLLPAMMERESRAEIVKASISNRGALILARDLDAAFEISNRIAPEHLQLAIDSALAHVPSVRHAGAIFVGAGTAEVIGDYTAGPSHVLPTSGTARFASPLGVYDFQTRSSLIECSPNGLVELYRAAAVLADEEGLTAHAASARARLDGQES